LSFQNLHFFVLEADFLLIENFVKVLSPIAKATVFLQNLSSTISVIIPIIVTLRKLLSNGDELRSIKDEFLAELDKRVDGVESNLNYFVATMLDPRFKTKYFLQERQDVCIAKLKEIAEQIAPTIIKPVEQEQEVQPSDADDFFSLITASSNDPMPNAVEPSIKIKASFLTLKFSFHFGFLLKLKSTWPAVIRRQSTQSHFGAPI
jgi:hypothetical protein